MVKLTDGTWHVRKGVSVVLTEVRNCPHGVKVYDCKITTNSGSINYRIECFDEKLAVKLAEHQAEIQFLMDSKNCYIERNM